MSEPERPTGEAPVALATARAPAPGEGDLSAGLKRWIVWAVLFAAVFVAAQWFLHERSRARFHFGHGVVELERGADGHYHWPGTIDGREVDFLVDTGASGIAIPGRLADRLGLAVEGRTRVGTAGGEVAGDVVRADLALEGGVRVERARMVVLAGLGENPLLGMDVLGRLHWRQDGRVLRVELGAPDERERGDGGRPSRPSV